MSELPPSPSSAHAPIARDLVHRDRMERAQRLRRENAEVRAQFRKEKASIRDSWQRLVNLGEGVFLNRDMRRAALNLLEDIEISRRREAQEVVGRERAEAATNASETRYQTLFERIDEAFCIIDVIFDASRTKALDYRFLQANPAFERHTGLVNSVGRTIRELVSGHEEHWFETYGRIALTGEPARFENHAGALGRHYDVYAFRIGEAGENRVAILFRDISERKRREANLAILSEISRELERLTDRARTMETLVAKIGAHFNASLCAFSAVGEGAATMNIVHAWHRAGIPSVRGELRISDNVADDFVRSCLAGETYVVHHAAWASGAHPTQVGELKTRGFISVPLLRDGAWRFNLTIADDGPRDWRLDEVELLRELTTRIWSRLERARAEDALRGSEQRLRRMINVPRVGVLTFDFAGTLLHANDAFLEIVGYGRAEFDARKFTWRDFTPPEHVAASEEAVNVVRRTGRAGPYEKEYFRKNGTRLWLMMVAADLGDGTIVKYAIDISDRKQAEDALRASEGRLREADLRKNNFLAMLGHELRNPLAAIGGGIALMRSEKIQAATRAKTLPIVAEQVAHMERLVEDLLDVTRIVAGQVQLRQERITVQKILHNAVEMLRTQIETGGFDLKMRISAQPLTVYGDPVRLNQVVVNVLGNAMKYSGEAREIELSAASNDRSATISVRDYGQGIAPEVLPRIFEPFMQARPTVTRGEGLGLGLAVVRQLVELHGGHVEAFSDGERKGSKFVIHLPFAADSQ